MHKRYFPSPLPRLALLGALCAGAVPAQAALSFDLDVATRNTVAAQGGKAPPDEVARYKVMLGEGYLSVSSASETMIYDLARRRRYQVDIKERSYVDYSLFDSIGFRVMELQNRKNLGGALAAAKIDLPVSDPLFDEQSLSLASTERKLSASGEAGATVLAVDGTTLARIAPGGTPVSASDADLFARMMRHRFGGHPLILARLSGEKRVPASFVMNHKEVGYAQTRTYTVTGLTQSAPASYDLKPYKPRAAAADEIDQLLDKAAAEAKPPPDAAKQAFEADTAAAYADKRALDAILGTVEWSLASGAPMRPPTPEQQALLRADPQVRAFTAAMRPKDKAALTASLDTLRELRKHTTRKQHMLDLFEANNRAKLGDQRTAMRLFASVLRANPSLAGAYKDMGDTLFSSYDMARAWRSWDAGRRMAPKLDMFKAVNEFEQKLLREHPEFF